MTFSLRKLALSCLGALLFTGAGLAQTGAISGKVKGEDGQPLKDALVKITRTDIKGNYQVKTNKKGEYFHAGLPLGQYTVALTVNNQEVDKVAGVRTTLGDPTPVDFDLQKYAAQRQEQQKAMEQAAQTGQVTDDLTRGMSKEQRAELDKKLKANQEAMAKNKALNDSFNAGMEAIKAKDYTTAIDQLKKASEMDATQHVIWGNLADAYVQSMKGKTGPEAETMSQGAMTAYQKAMELAPADASYHNNYALALAQMKKFPEAQAELDKAAQLDPPNAGKYYYNLGALLTNAGQLEPSGAAFKKAIETDPNYADAHYQYGVYLISKATTTPDGKIVPPAGTKESFEQYLALRPDGPFAQSAKDMLTTMGATIDTKYVNPNAPKAKPVPARKK